MVLDPFRIHANHTIRESVSWLLELIFFRTKADAGKTLLYPQSPAILDSIPGSRTLTTQLEAEAIG
jgi:hypothetical protein